MEINLKHQRIDPLAGDLLILREEDSETKQYFLFVKEEDTEGGSEIHPIKESIECESFIISIENGRLERVIVERFDFELTMIKTVYTKKRYIVHQIISSEDLEIREIWFLFSKLSEYSDNFFGKFSEYLPKFGKN